MKTKKILSVFAVIFAFCIIFSVSAFAAEIEPVEPIEETSATEAEASKTEVSIKFNVGDTFTFRELYSQEELEYLFNKCFYKSYDDKGTPLALLYESPKSATHQPVRIYIMLFELGYRIDVYLDNSYIIYNSSYNEKWYNYTLKEICNSPEINIKTDDFLFYLPAEDVNKYFLNKSNHEFTLNNFFTSLGDGLKIFLPNVAAAGVDTVDIFFVTEDGGLTTVAVLTIIGIITASGLGVFAMIKRKIKKNIRCKI